MGAFIVGLLTQYSHGMTVFRHRRRECLRGRIISLREKMMPRRARLAETAIGDLLLRRTRKLGRRAPIALNGARRFRWNERRLIGSSWRSRLGIAWRVTHSPGGLLEEDGFSPLVQVCRRLAGRDGAHPCANWGASLPDALVVAYREKPARGQSDARSTAR